MTQLKYLQAPFDGVLFPIRKPAVVQKKQAVVVEAYGREKDVGQGESRLTR